MTSAICCSSADIGLPDSRFAQASALALLAETELDAESIVRRSLGIAADICIYTNDNLVIETLESD